jgi:glycosyltransferase involved in cell wall biosynthesis
MLHLVTGLNLKRFDPVVWCPGEYGYVGDLLRERGVTVERRRLDLSNAAAVDEIVHWLQGLHISIFFSFASIFCPDIVLARAAGIRLCFTRRSNMRWWDPQNTLRPEERVRNEKTDVIVVLCRAMWRQCREVEGLHPDRMKQVYSGVHIPFAPTPISHSQTVGNVANYRPEKGQEHLLKALGRLSWRVPDAELLIVGRPGGNLQRMAEELGLEERVTFTGELADTSPTYMKMCVYAHPSQTEGFSSAILEAMANSLPVVATRVGGAAEAVVDGVTGYLVPPGDAGALASALEALLLDETKRRRMGMAGRSKVQDEFSVERMVRQHEELFEEHLMRVGLQCDEQSVASA